MITGGWSWNQNQGKEQTGSDRPRKLMSRDPEEERFARQDSHRYSGWSSVFAIAVIVIVLMIVFLVYYLK
jgi:hypothetical protein